MSIVTEIPAASSDLALAHFEAEFGFETDCWDVHFAVSNGAKDFILLDVRSHDAFDRGHVPTAISLPHGKIIASKLADYPLDALFVVYCAGPIATGRPERPCGLPTNWPAGQADARRSHRMDR